MTRPPRSQIGGRMRRACRRPAYTPHKSRHARCRRCSTPAHRTTSRSRRCRASLWSWLGHGGGVAGGQCRHVHIVLGEVFDLNARQHDGELISPPVVDRRNIFQRFSVLRIGDAVQHKDRSSRLEIERACDLLVRRLGADLVPRRLHGDAELPLPDRNGRDARLRTQQLGRGLDLQRQETAYQPDGTVCIEVEFFNAQEPLVDRAPECLGNVLGRNDRTEADDARRRLYATRVDHFRRGLHAGQILLDPVADEGAEPSLLRDPAFTLENGKAAAHCHATQSELVAQFLLGAELIPGPIFTPDDRLAEPVSKLNMQGNPAFPVEELTVHTDPHSARDHITSSQRRQAGCIILSHTHRPQSAQAHLLRVQRELAMGKRTDPYDVEVGRRIRARRVAKQMSQMDLAGRLGLTFQQVQKYEKGTNRVAAGRLKRIARILEVPILYFFDDTDEFGNDGVAADGLVDNSRALRLMRAYSRIDNSSLQQSILDLTEKIATERRSSPSLKMTS